MASNGPPDNFHNQQTQYANYGLGGQPPSGEPPPAFQPPAATGADQQAPDFQDPFDQQTEPKPWYRKPSGIIAWIIAVLILLALIVYGITELIQGGQGTTPAPSTSTTPTTTATPTTTPPSSETTPSSETPPTSSAVEPPAQQPTQQPTRQPTQPQPTHRHHLPAIPGIPWTITIPGMPAPITIPPSLRP